MKAENETNSFKTFFSFISNQIGQNEWNRQASLGQVQMNANPSTSSNQQFNQNFVSSAFNEGSVESKNLQAKESVDLFNDAVDSQKQKTNGSFGSFDDFPKEQVGKTANNSKFFEN